MKKPPQQAFGLIELLLVLLLLALLASLATPSFHSWTEHKRIEVLSEQFQSQLNLARVSSVLRQRDVEACGSSTGLSCDDRWNLGWIVYFPQTHQLISQHRLNIQDRVMWKGSSKRIRFHSNGTAPFGNGRFYVCNRDNEVVVQVVLNRQGRLRRTRGLEPGEFPGIRCQ